MQPQWNEGTWENLCICFHPCGGVFVVVMVCYCGGGGGGGGGICIVVL